MKTFIASLVFALLSISLLAQSPVTLKLNLEKGRVYKVKSTSKQAIQQTANGQQYAIDVLSNTVFSFRVLKQENDVMDISFKLDTIASKISSPMFSRETNSTKPGTEPLEKIMNKMSTYNIVAKISTAGKFLQFVNLGKYTDSILFVLDSVPASKRDDARKQAIALLKESAIKSMIEPIFSYLPEKPVNIGDTWETSYFNVSATLSILLLNTHKLEGIENNLARVSGTSEAESMPSTDPAAKMTQELKGTSTFDSTIDLITGLSIRNKSKSHFEGVTKMMNGTTEMMMPMKIDGDTETVISK